MNFHFKQCFDSHSVYLTFFLPQYCETLLSCLAVCQKWQVKQLSLYCNAVPVSTVALRKTYELRGVFALLGASSCHWLAYKLLCHRPSSLEVRSFAQDDHYSREGTSCQNTYKTAFFMAQFCDLLLEFSYKKEVDEITHTPASVSKIIL